MARSSQLDALVSLKSALGALSALLVVAPLGGFIPEVIPVQLGIPDWRFGAFGYYLSGLTLPAVGLVTGLLAARVSEKPAWSWVAALIAGGLAVVAVAVLPMFLMDGSTLVEGAADPRVTPAFTKAMKKTSLIAICAIPCLGAVAITGVRQARAIAQESEARRSKIVV